jgi:cytochrome c oxidase subunit II
MNSTAVVIAVSYAVVTVVGAGVFLLLWRSTQAQKEIDEQAMARREKGWLVVVACALTALLFATIFFTPYGESAPPGSQVVNVQARQFAFVIDPGRIRAGEPVEFRLTTPDVNHGFGVYTEDDEFVLQAQVVPDGVTSVVHTFDEPGSYKVLCLEFCGLNHHAMVGRFEVVG